MFKKIYIAKSQASGKIITETLLITTMLEVNKHIPSGYLFV